MLSLDMRSDSWRRGLMDGPGGVSLFSHVCCTFYLFSYVLFSLSLHFKALSRTYNHIKQ